MTYNAYDQSLQDGSPVYLLEVARGSEVWYYAQHNKNLTIGGQTYQASSIRFPEVKQSEAASKNNIKFEFPNNDPIGIELMKYWSEQRISITVKRFHITDTLDEEIRVYWKGRIAGVTGDGNKISIECETIFTSMKRNGLGPRVTKNCRHNIYSRGCGISLDANAIPSTSFSVSGSSQVTVTEAASYEDGWFRGGLLKDPFGVFYTILNHVGSTLSLSRHPRLLEELIDRDYGYGSGYGKWYGGTISVTIYPGCVRTLAACEGKWDNRRRYGGFLWRPAKNPFGGSSIV